MTTSITLKENKLIRKLQSNYCPLIEATFLVLLITREHVRPKTELIDILKQYPNLNDNNELDHLINKYLSKKLLVETVKDNTTVIRPSESMIKSIIEKAEITKKEIEIMQNEIRSFVFILGKTTDETVYRSYHDLLRGAQSEILLPMIATTPKLEVVEILKEKAKNGVDVKILYGNPSFINKLRGRDNDRNVQDFLLKWYEHTKDLKGFQIRIMKAIEDIELGTSMLIDNQLLRLDIFDPYCQRSLQGTMVEFTNQVGSNLNIIRWYKRRFSRAWKMGLKYNEPKLLYYLRRNIGLIICIPLVLFVIKLLDHKSNWSFALSSILASITGAILYDFYLYRIRPLFIAKESF